VSLTAAHLDAFLLAGLSAEQIVALVKTDIEERERATGQRRAKDRDRQKRHRESRGVTRTNADSELSQRPPKDNKSKPLGSEANASGGEPPADPLKQVFDLGVELLTATGTTEKQARSLLGKWRKSHGEAKVLQGLLDCRTKAISNPVEWLEKRFVGAKYVSASGYEYRGDEQAVMREAERRADWGTYWKAKANLDEPRRASA
jgi:hypothetical protein